MHEIGHFIDLSALGPYGDLASWTEKRPSGEREARSWELVQGVIQEIKGTENCKRLLTVQEGADERGNTDLAGEIRFYLLQPNELFARAYVQYVAWRSGDLTLFERLDRVLMHDDPLFRLRQWPYAQFLPIVERFDTLFESLGWLTRTKNA